MVMIMLLFLGPLTHNFLDGDWSAFSQHGQGSWIWWRNFVVAPCAEEWVFRACMCPLLYVAGFGRLACSLVPPLFFGIAHTHHVISHISEKGGMTVKQAIVVVMFQLFYTTLFGWLAAFFFLATGSIFGPMAAHSFCNFMGFPDFQGAFTHPTKKISLIVAYIAGIILFLACVMITLNNWNAFKTPYQW